MLHCSEHDLLKTSIGLIPSRGTLPLPAAAHVSTLWCYTRAQTTTYLSDIYPAHVAAASPRQHMTVQGVHAGVQRRRSLTSWSSLTALGSVLELARLQMANPYPVSLTVNLIPQDQEGCLCQVLHAQQRIKLSLRLRKPLGVLGVNEEHDAGHFGEIVFPQPSGLLMTCTKL